MKFNRIALAATAVIAVAGMSGVACAEMTKMVGGAAMYPSKNIIQNAVNSKDNTILVTAVKAAGTRRHVAGPWSVHRFRANQCGLQSASRRNCRYIVEAREQGSTRHRPDLSCVARPGDNGRYLRGCQTRRRRSNIQDCAGRAADYHTERQGLRDHRFEGTYGAHHDRRRAAIEWRDPCHQQGVDALIKRTVA